MRWSEEEQEYMRDHYGKDLLEELCRYLGRSKYSVKDYARRNGLRVPRKTWNARLSESIKRGMPTGKDHHSWKGGISRDRTRYKEIERSRFPERVKARELVSKAKRAGKLLQEPCAVCGKEKTEAHHEDYSKPLDVVWLCRKHHMERHGKK